MTASSACSTVASGVVRMLRNRSCPIRVSTVPIRPVVRPSAVRAESMRYAVVVLPFVPVTPKSRRPRSSVP